MYNELSIQTYKGESTQEKMSGEFLKPHPLLKVVSIWFWETRGKEKQGSTNLKIKRIIVFWWSKWQKAVDQIWREAGDYRNIPKRTPQAPNQPPTFTKHNWTGYELGNVCVLIPLDGSLTKPSLTPNPLTSPLPKSLRSHSPHVFSSRSPNSTIFLLCSTRPR